MTTVSTVVGLTGTTFLAAASNPANWVINTQGTGLTVNQITVQGGGAGVIIDFNVNGGSYTGTPAITIQAKAAALASDTDSNVVEVGLME